MTRLASCLYGILGLSPTATKSDIKEQFYKLSKLYHPDLTKDSEMISVNKRKFTQILEAYHILSDSKLRQEYDIKHGHRQPLKWSRTVPVQNQWNIEKSHNWSSKIYSAPAASFDPIFESRWANLAARQKKKSVEEQRKYAELKRAEDFRVFRNRVVVVGVGVIVYILINGKSLI